MTSPISRTEGGIDEFSAQFKNNTAVVVSNLVLYGYISLIQRIDAPISTPLASQWHYPLHHVTPDHLIPPDNPLDVVLVAFYLHYTYISPIHCSQRA